MELTTVLHTIRPRHPFRIARGEKTEQANVYVRIMEGGLAGYGEAAPNAYYHENAQDVAARLDNIAPHLAGRTVNSVEDIEQTWRDLWPLLDPSRCAQCALDIALWDLVAKKRQVTVSQLAHKARPRELETFATLGMCAPEELDDKIEELADFPLIKLKLGGRADDMEVLQAVRNKTTSRISIDANCGWGGRNVALLSEDLAAMRVLFIEQPFPPSEDTRMKFICLASSLPIFADESCVTLEDVARLKASFSGINVKLNKCGGITPALKMVEQARRQKQLSMVGCMLESSCGIAAGAVVAQRTDYADLDGAWLLAEDPFVGARMLNGFLQVGDMPGLGVEPVEGLFPV